MPDNLDLLSELWYIVYFRSGISDLLNLLALLETVLGKVTSESLIFLFVCVELPIFLQVLQGGALYRVLWPKADPGCSLSRGALKPEPCLSWPMRSRGFLYSVSLCTGVFRLAWLMDCSLRLSQHGLPSKNIQQGAAWLLISSDDNISGPRMTDWWRSIDRADWEQ